MNPPKILITLRHPGPVAAVMEFVQTIDQKMEIIFVLSDAALQLMQDRYHKILKRHSFYYFQNEWLKETKTDIAKEQRGKTEFNSMKEQGFCKLQQEMKQIILQESPDIILRTTPALKFGVDEAITSAANEIGSGKKIRCYQEIYDCGMDLEQIKVPIAVVDEIAKMRLQKRKVEAIPIGWMNQSSFQGYPNYCLVREQIRNKLGISEQETVIIYCTVASGNDKAEKKHFQGVAKHKGNRRMYLKFHPRNAEVYKREMLKIANQYGVAEAKNFEMEEVLAVADVIISSGSAIQFDCLQYQVISKIDVLKTNSVFVVDANTKEIMQTVFQCDIQPYMEEGMGSIILGSFAELENLEEKLQQEKIKVTREAYSIFHLEMDQVKENFLKYLFEEKES